MSVLFTPGQLRQAVSIAPETYRHWKTALPPLQRVRGHSPCFTSGDILAVSVVHALAVGLAVKVGALTPTAHSLFEICNLTPWPRLERAELRITILSARVSLLAEADIATLEEPYISVPLAPLIARIREQLLDSNSTDQQRALNFPPHSLESQKAVTGRASK